jgi:manganese peroxidase
LPRSFSQGKANAWNIRTKNLTLHQSYTPPGKLGSDACAADTCCVWDSVATDLVKLFTGSDGLCTDDARAAVRMGFHDAGAWSKTSGPGGADGSLLLSADEITRSENNGMQNIRIELLKVLAKYATFGVGGADLVQFAHNVAVVACPLGPRQITFVGRDDSIKSDNTGLLPDTHSPATALIELFAEKTFTVIDLISLIGAHTTAKQRFVDTSKAGQPLDSTPGVWDVAFYGEVLGAQPAGVFRLPSDDAFAKNNESTRGFTVFSDPATGQAAWNALYAKAYTRLSLLGVNKINQLTDCTKVLPNAILSVPPPSNSSSSSSSSISASSTSSSLSSFTRSVSTTGSSSYSSATGSASSYSGYSSGASTKPHPTFSSRTSHSSSVPYTTSTICVTETYVDPILTSTITTTIPLTTTVCPVETATSTASSGPSTITIYATKTFTYTVGSQTKTVTTSFPVKPAHSNTKTSSATSSTPYSPVKLVTSSTPVAPVLTKTSTYSESACPIVATVTATKIVWA